MSNLIWIATVCDGFLLLALFLHMKEKGGSELRPRYRVLACTGILIMLLSGCSERDMRIQTITPDVTTIDESVLCEAEIVEYWFDFDVSSPAAQPGRVYKTEFQSPFYSPERYSFWAEVKREGSEETEVIHATLNSLRLVPKEDGAPIRFAEIRETKRSGATKALSDDGHLDCYIELNCTIKDFKYLFELESFEGYSQYQYVYILQYLQDTLIEPDVEVETDGDTQFSVSGESDTSIQSRE